MSKELEKVKLSILSPGEVFKIGKYNFIVLAQNPEAHETKVISRDLIFEDERFGKNRNYKESSIKTIMENKIQPMIEKELGLDSLIKHRVDLISTDMQDEFGTYECKVRPVTFDEARLYNNLLVNEDLPNWYWTLTPWSTEERGCEYSMIAIRPAGNFSKDLCDNYNGCRPFCILKSNIFVSKER